MKKTIFLLAFQLFLVADIFSQTNKITSIDQLFGGIPIQKSYSDWVVYINQNPDLGIDSTNRNGIFSSIKSKGQHFPFPDTAAVKIFLYTGIKFYERSILPTDTIRRIFISAKFGSNKQAKKNAKTCSKQIESVLDNSYKAKSEFGDLVEFTRGVNAGFPDVQLAFGKAHNNNVYEVSLSCTFEDWEGMSKISSLDSFFAGIPLQKNYESWVQKLAGSPVLGIDSTNNKGVYSSIKSTNHFPFPDSVLVKILVKTEMVIMPPGQPKPEVPQRTILIEGVFGKNEKARLDAYKYFKQLTEILETMYENSFVGLVFASFVNGKNANFPDVQIETGFFEEQGFYYVLLMCKLYDVDSKTK